ncbi:FecR domain-containing protein [Carboxylicivirga sp. A043]|uniref:FecR family protein n=1 Tax=Carboxylicivirga litoralis TaxID=2816963 RepID=UPI0021CB2702|nr:FecR domain-containing protein [Carboxylicivirga sp. A043]MCU4156367.1 FecR domain-containing protein [Carboxylicivirga sp. A043]
MGEINQKYRSLIEKYVAGDALVDEITVLDKWLNESQDNKRLFNTYKKEAEVKNVSSADDDWNRFVDKYNITNKQSNNKRLIITLSSIAAAISIVVGLSFQSLNKSTDKYAVLQIEHPGEVTETTLELADGQFFSISEQHASLSADEQGIRFKQGNKMCVEKVEKVEADLNTIQVPYGRTAQLTLADGTQVWLNAGSQLIFPIHFNAAEKREVMLVGEGYFDVTPNKTKPFKVLTDKITYTVLGTSFNIRSYKNSNAQSAVLVEGSLQVERNSTFNKQQTILKPGQKCNYHVINNTLQVKQVNTVIYTSWKDGYLSLDRNTIRMLAKQMEQFYNCEITVCKELQVMPMQLSGKLLLDEDIEQVCQALCDLTGVNYKMNNNHIEFYIEE